MNTDVDEEVLMVLKGELAELMVQIAPEMYREYLTTNRKGTKVLYVQLQKALYGLMRLSLLFYRKLRKERKRYGMGVNPYDPCVVNMTTKSGKQLTVVWHVDNLMALCEIDFQLMRFSCYLRSIYGPKLTINTTTSGWTWSSRRTERLRCQWCNTSRTSLRSSQRRSEERQRHPHMTNCL